MLTTKQAGENLKVTDRRVLALIRSKQLRATKFGHVWMIDPKDLAAVRVRKPGRPKKGN